MSTHEMKVAKPIAASHKVPLHLLDRLIAIERSPIGRTGPRGVNIQVEDTLTRSARGQRIPSTPPTKTPFPTTENGLTDIGEGVDEVRIGSVEIRNFGIFEDTTLNISHVAGRPIHIIEGNNGAGKSTLIKALRFALHGDINRSALATLLFQGASTKGATIRVSVVLCTEDGEIRITRVAKCQFGGGGWRVSGPYDVVVEVGGRQLREEEATQWLHATFPPRVMAYFIFDAETSPVAELAQRAGDPNHRVREQLEHALGISPLRKLRERCRGFAKRCHQDIRSDFPGTARTQAEIEACEAALRDLAQRRGRLTKDVAEGQKAIEEANDELRTLHAQLDPERDDNRQRLQKMSGEIEEKLNTERRLKQEWFSSILPLRLLEAPLRRVNAKEKHPELWFQGARHTVEAVARMACEGRLPWAPEASSWEHQQLAAHLITALGLPDQKSNQSEEIRLLLLQRIAHLSKARVPATPREVARLVAELDELSHELEDLGQAEDTALTLAQHEKLLKKKGEAENRLHQAANQEKTIAREVANAHERLAELQGLFREAKTAEAAAARLQTQVDIAERCATAFQNLAEQLCEQRVGVLEQASTVLFRRLTNKPDYYDRLQFDRDSLCYRLIDHGGSPVPLERSTGERAVLALSLVHGLQQASGRGFPLIIEAPLKPLDAAHSNGVLKDFLARARGQTILLVKPGEVTREMSSLIEAVVAQRHVLTRPDPRQERAIFESMEA
ncbi:MAG: AAA family ATPase [Proteobacteria bacterium]|nr:AAA family ATPase [Pseudomonadota bacterium]